MQNSVNEEITRFYIRTARYVFLGTTIALASWLLYQTKMESTASGFSLWMIALIGLVCWLIAIFRIKMVIAPKIASGQVYSRKFWSN